MQGIVDQDWRSLKMDGEMRQRFAMALVQLTQHNFFCSLRPERASFPFLPTCFPLILPLSRHRIKTSEPAPHFDGKDHT